MNIYLGGLKVAFINIEIDLEQIKIDLLQIRIVFDERLPARLLNQYLLAQHLSFLQ